MKKNNTLYPPGLKRQYEFLISTLELNGLKILVLGSSSYSIAKLLFLKSNNNIDIVVEDYESLLAAQLESVKNPEISVKLMDFEKTDYLENTFDLVYAQGSISDKRRKKIIKEINRILKPNGYLCVGEIVKLEDKIPNFVNEIYELSNLDPLYLKNLNSFYEERNFNVIASTNLSNTLREYYSLNLKLFKENIKLLAPNEKAYYKTILNKINHESNVYLKLGGDRFMGMQTLVLKMG
jgi:ubiquinone/menaquinone biosynthesis C-methylase UbiE